MVYSVVDIVAAAVVFDVVRSNFHLNNNYSLTTICYVHDQSYRAGVDDVHCFYLHHF